MFDSKEGQPNFTLLVILTAHEILVTINPWIKVDCFDLHHHYFKMSTIMDLLVIMSNITTVVIKITIFIEISKSHLE